MHDVKQSIWSYHEFLHLPWIKFDDWIERNKLGWSLFPLMPYFKNPNFIYQDLWIDITALRGEMFIYIKVLAGVINESKKQSKIA